MSFTDTGTHSFQVYKTGAETTWYEAAPVYLQPLSGHHHSYVGKQVMYPFI